MREEKDAEEQPQSKYKQRDNSISAILGKKKIVKHSSSSLNSSTQTTAIQIIVQTTKMYNNKRTPTSRHDIESHEVTGQGMTEVQCRGLGLKHTYWTELITRNSGETALNVTATR